MPDTPDFSPEARAAEENENTTTPHQYGPCGGCGRWLNNPGPTCNECASPERYRPSPEAMRLAFADPPYLGQCAQYGHHHEAPWGCWDSPSEQGRLIRHLNREYDGWAVSASATADSLAVLGPIAKDLGARIASWVKPFAAYKANVRIAYTWEPVIFKPGRDSSKDGAPVGRDHLREPITMRKGFTGAKPPRFCRWVLDLLGYIEGDELTDIFPGTGVMDRVRAQGVLL